MISIFKREKNSLSKRFSNWIINLNNPDSSILAINFGIFQTTKSYSIHLVGSETYDVLDDDWACNDDFEFSEKYFHLTKIETKNKDWKEIEDLVEKLIRDFVNSQQYNDSILKSIENITCGFDDGELIKIK